MSSQIDLQVAPVMKNVTVNKMSLLKVHKVQFKFFLILIQYCAKVMIEYIQGAPRFLHKAVNAKFL